jgi:hypothetical protein
MEHDCSVSKIFLLDFSLSLNQLLRCRPAKLAFASGLLANFFRSLLAMRGLENVIVHRHVLSIRSGITLTAASTVQLAIDPSGIV